MTILINDMKTKLGAIYASTAAVPPSSPPFSGSLLLFHAHNCTPILSPLKTQLHLPLFLTAPVIINLYLASLHGHPQQIR